MAFENNDEFSFDDIPDFDGLIVATRNQSAAVGTEIETVDFIIVSLDNQQLFILYEIPAVSLWKMRFRGTTLGYLGTSAAGLVAF